MCVSDLFLKCVRSVILCALIVIAVLGVAHGQNSGTVGIQAQLTVVFTAQASGKSSGGIWQCGVSSGVCPFLPDIGQGASILFYCTTGFSGTVDLEFNPTPASASTFYPLVQASFPGTSPDTACHTLQLGGYFPNLRSTLTVNTGSISAWYTASGAPIPSVSSGIGTNGPSSPINCDRNATTQITTGTTSAIVGVGPLLSGDTVVICSFTLSFNGATSAGVNLLNWYPLSNCTVTGSTTWAGYTTANTPQTFTVDAQQRTPSVSTFPFPCFTNGSGATVSISVSWASIHGL